MVVRLYENVVYAILAMCFIILAQRNREKTTIPILTIIYRFGFILCLALAVSQSFSFQQTLTTFTYSGGQVISANSQYSYSNLVTSQQDNIAILIIFAVIMIFSIVVEIAEETLTNADRVAKSFMKGK